MLEFTDALARFGEDLHADEVVDVVLPFFEGMRSSGGSAAMRRAGLRLGRVCRCPPVESRGARRASVRF